MGWIKNRFSGTNLPEISTEATRKQVADKLDETEQVLEALDNSLAAVNSAIAELEEDTDTLTENVSRGILHGDI